MKNKSEIKKFKITIHLFICLFFDYLGYFVYILYLFMQVL